ncbi:MAG: V-type ATP synthase subunit D [Candidatus Njordarchaeota archaeon]
MSSEYVLPTKIFLMELRKKLSLVNFSKKILEKKRDSLQSAINKTMEEMKEVIVFLKRKLVDLLEYIVSVHLIYGDSVRRYALAQREKLVLNVQYVSERGIIIPVLTIGKTPKIKDNYPEGVRALAREMEKNLPDMLKLVGIFLRLEILLRELEITNRIVNTLDKILIPNIKEKISYILSMLSEFFISELSSLRVLLSQMEGV